MESEGEGVGDKLKNVDLEPANFIIIKYKTPNFFFR